MLYKQIVANHKHCCTWAFIAEGNLHVSSETYQLLTQSKINISNIEIINVDEMLFELNLDLVKIFCGQQVKIFDNGFYLGDGTITSYPLHMDFNLAEVSMHFPFKGETAIYPVKNLDPIL